MMPAVVHVKMRLSVIQLRRIVARNAVAGTAFPRALHGITDGTSPCAARKPNA